MNTLETVATILIALPALLYAGACLFRTEDMVAMLPKRIPGIRVLVRGLGVAFLVSAIFLNFERFAPAAGWTMAGSLLVTAFGVHLPDVIKQYPEELGEAMIELEQRAAAAGVVKDVALAGAAVLVAVTAA